MPAFHDNRGITLIELLLSLMILVIVLAAAFAIHTLGQKAYERSIIQSNLQHDTVKIAGFITQSVRAAKEVEILGTDLNVPETIDDDNNYIYLYQAPASGIKTVVLKNKNGIIPLIRYPAQVNNYTLLFAKEQAGSVLHYTINGVSSTQKYNLDTKVKLETLDSNGFVGVLNGGAVLRLKLKAGASFPLNITGNFIQDTVKLSGSGNRSIDQTDEKYTSWEFELFYTTFKNSLDNSDIEIANLPAGLSYSVVRKSSNILRITVNGTAEADIVSTLTPQ
ncbi:MAG: prepilin-type N-terminal cleavage/methylation domain-containing protein, partial [Methanomassiliicoccales archaeon]